MECLVRRTRTARPPFPATTLACSALSLLAHRTGHRTRRTPGWSNWSIYSPRTSPDSAHQIGRPLTPHAGSPVALHAPIHWTMQRYVKNRGWWNVRLHNPPLPQPLCVLSRRSLAVSMSLSALSHQIGRRPGWSKWRIHSPRTSPRRLLLSKSTSKTPRVNVGNPGRPAGNPQTPHPKPLAPNSQDRVVI